MGAPVAHFEISSKDPGRAAAFYGKLFDWTVSPGPAPDYSMVDTGAGEDGVGGGIGATDGPDDPGGITIYVKVDNLTTYLDRAEELGGRTILPPTDLPEDYGAFALLADPDGNTIGLWVA